MGMNKFFDLRVTSYLPNFYFCSVNSYNVVVYYDNDDCWQITKYANYNIILYEYNICIDTK